MDKEILERFDRLEGVFREELAEIRCQVEGLYKNGLSSLNARISVLEGKPDCPVLEHTAILASHDSDLRTIKKLLWAVISAVALVVAKSLINVFLKVPI